MAIDQTRNPASAASDNSVGDADWTNPSNAISSNNSYATCSVGSFLSTYYLKFTNFNFNIPEGASIIGIKVSFEAKCDLGDVGDILNIRLVVDGVITGDTDSSGGNMTDTDAIYSFGTSTSLWGLTPTRAQVNASDFGFVVDFLNSNFGTAVMSVDSASVTIYHTVLAAPFNKRRITVGNGMVTSEIAY